MLSLIFLLVLGWLLYKAFFPCVSPYYGKVPTDDKILQCNHRGLVGHCQEDEHLLGDLSIDLKNNGQRLVPLDEDYWNPRKSDNDLFGSPDHCHNDYWSSGKSPFGD
ncbi:MAG: hypothetical protein M0P73_07535 [Syntrophobacterales bacterium]|jgi:hypothetical protein|nr:hypothetical protein [Syntrophobacterales bacterium]